MGEENYITDFKFAKKMIIGIVIIITIYGIVITSLYLFRFNDDAVKKDQLTYIHSIWWGNSTGIALVVGLCLVTISLYTSYIESRIEISRKLSGIPKKISSVQGSISETGRITKNIRDTVGFAKSMYSAR
jgi:uncharacterized membrane protein YccF (DUF307 family)